MRFEWCNKNLSFGCSDYMADQCEGCNIARAFEYGRSLQECNDVDESMKQCEEDLLMDDVINHPSHYTDGSIEVIDYIEDKGFGYHLGNAIKYISRAGKKDPSKETEDLRKAVWYIERYIGMKEKEDDYEG